MTTDRSATLAAFAKQIDWCTTLAAPLTAALLRALAGDIAGGGPTAALVGDWPGDPLADALALRLAGGLHALVLRGADAELAACYPPASEASFDRLRAAVLGAVVAQEPFLRDFLRAPPQTNEVGRSGVLLGGFLQVAAATRLPLEVLEIGASAGLNLIWDRYAYRIGARDWGDAASPVRLAPDWQGSLPPLDAPLAVASRAACDIAPIDLGDADAQLRLRAYVWPDQPERVARIGAAMALARTVGARVDKADAGDWVEARLADPAPGVARVLYHSIMWQYMPVATQARLHDAIARAGAQASERAPFAWLRFEPPAADMRPELRLALWPGGHDQRLAIAHPHGRGVHWLAD